MVLLGSAAAWDVVADGVLCASPAYFQKNGIPQHPRELAQHRCLRFKLPANRHLRRTCLDSAGISGQSIDLVANYWHSGELQRVMSP